MARPLEVNRFLKVASFLDSYSTSHSSTLGTKCTCGPLLTFFPFNIPCSSHSRISVFFSLASLSGAFSGILAYGLIRIDRGRPGWAWIFIVEGVFTVAFGLMSFFALPNSPSTAYFLTQQEKDYVLEKLTEDGTVEIDGDGEKFSWGEVGRVFLMPQVGLIALVFFLDGTWALCYFGHLLTIDSSSRDGAVWSCIVRSPSRSHPDLH